METKKIVIGTHNKAKIGWINQLMKEYDVIFISPSELEIHIDIKEDGKTAVDNALIKAQAYHKASDIACLSSDDELLFIDFDENDERQPLTRVRRVGNSEYELNDDEMIEYYGHLAYEYGGKLTAYYRTSYAIVNQNGEVFTFENPYEKDPLFIDSLAFYIVDTPHKKRKEGFPLDSLSVNMHTGNYYYDEDSNDVKPKEINQRYQEYIRERKRLVSKFIASSLQLKKK